MSGESISFNNFMLQLLSIIEYQDNKEQFVEEFVTLIYKQALVELLSSLPADNQDAVRKLVNQQKELNRAVDALEKSEWAQTYNLALALASKKILEEYIQTINSSLTPNQKEMVELLFQTGKEYLFTSPSE